MNERKQFALSAISAALSSAVEDGTLETLLDELTFIVLTVEATNGGNNAQSN